MPGSKNNPAGDNDQVAAWELPSFRGPGFRAATPDRISRGRPEVIGDGLCWKIQDWKTKRPDFSQAVLLLQIRQS
jgi:hypothetical protein